MAPKLPPRRWRPVLRASPPPALAALAALLAALAAGTGCGAGERPDEPRTEAQAVEVAGLRYRATMFRELNTRSAPDRAFWSGPPPDRGKGYFAAFVEVCNISDRRRTPPDGFRLLDSFGTSFRPKHAGAEEAFAYEPRELAPGECIPAEGSIGEEAVAGSVLLFELPFAVLSNRPLYLRLPERAGTEPPRIRLDV